MVLNYIWIGFFLISFAMATVKLAMGDVEVFSLIVKGAFDMAKTAVMDIALPLVGVMSFWLGFMKIAERGGAVDALSRWISPVFVKLFPSIPKGSPVMGHIMMNFAANMLGLDSAATPIGLKAMQGMQDLNTDKETASDAQIMFLVLNTSGLTIIPVNIIAQRAIFQASNPSDVFLPILLATTFSTLTGLLYIAWRQKIQLVSRTFTYSFLGILALLTAVIWFIPAASAAMRSVMDSISGDQISVVSSVASNVILFGVIVTFILLGIIKKLNVFEAFVDGAKDGFDICIKLMPYLIGILVSIAVFRACGAMELVLGGMKHVVEALGYNAAWVDAMPTAFMKPLSGGGSRAMMIDTMKQTGPDSFASTLSCMFQGAADTTLYIIAVYFGSVGIKKTRYSVSGGMIADLAGVIAAIALAYVFFADRL